MALVVALTGTFVYFKRKRYKIVIPQEKIDSALAEKVPVSKKYLLIFAITYLTCSLRGPLR